MDVFRLRTEPDDARGASPCSVACALGVNQRAYHALLRADRLEDALDELRRSHPMPAVTGRLCPHPCETECSRVRLDGAVGINALEEYLGDRLLEAGPGDAPPREAPPESPGRVAVIGSGPAGLAAAYFLALDGVAVTVFEKDAEAGGLLRSAVPAFRLPAAVLDAQLAYYRDLGVEFRTGVRVGADVTLAGLRSEGFGAFVAATGASAALALAAPGAGARGVTGAVEFLGAVRAGRIDRLEGGAVVVGGGSVALDAARTALRLGAAPVQVVCLEVTESGLRDSMPALEEELADALAEGVVVHPSKGVGEVITAGGAVAGVSCVDCLRVRDDEGGFAPEFASCELPFELSADTVIVAVGQGPDASLVPPEFAVDARGLIVADAGTGAAGAEAGEPRGLFAAGDGVYGPATVVEALAAGRRAAAAAVRFLRGEEVVAPPGDARERTPELPPDDRGARAVDRMTPLPREVRRQVPAEERRHTFEEAVEPFDAPRAEREVERCLTCGSLSAIAYLDDCQACRLCQLFCPARAIAVTEGAVLGSLHDWGVVLLGEEVAAWEPPPRGPA